MNKISQAKELLRQKRPNPKKALKILEKVNNDEGLYIKGVIYEQYPEYGGPDAAIREYKKVKVAMNDINAAQRMRIASNEKGEADKILKVKAAEAEAESKALQGKGIANQRKAIIEGLKESVDDFQRSIEGSTAKDVMTLVLMTQYFDTIKEVSQSSNTNTILLPHTPAGMNEISDQIRDAMITANEVSKSKIVR
jgi:hypothetical protein